MSWLKLQWARFFTLAGWEWKLASLPGFDFVVTFPCSHGDCVPSHTLVVRICDKPYKALAEKYSAFTFAYDEPHPALFGDGPSNTYWEMVHGPGGGSERVTDWMTRGNADVDQLWKRAAHE